ncbi:hypothetical protein AJ79_04236 [Helicocarpus griseus UAMH5409]|uniref:SMP-30/Gluconolactonase/LRE-like region domain-containing protein n=1 Tax=Helicocarpus griseus UAMH5409 TaxID=1447875 RepID=A0A2B7XV39_9EURO|nr:hypothetical protein AJ79_04236 [Helicocarpus griseus UAMH5409]
MPEIQKWSVSEPYLELSGKLLEGPYYDEERNELRFVDILEEKLHVLDLAKGPQSLKSFDIGVPIGVTGNIEGPVGDDSIVVAAKHGFAKVDRQTGQLTYIQRIFSDANGENMQIFLGLQDQQLTPLMSSRIRFNDGAIDSRGRFWAGSMTDLKVAELTNDGILYRLDPDQSLHKMIEKMEIPNGMDWNKADDILYVTDTASGNIYIYDFDAETGVIANRRVFFTVEGEPKPDGFAMDDEGCLWVALWGGSKVIRVSPEAKIVGEIEIPTKNVTCAEFAGTELFITTANVDNNAQSHDRFAGQLFKVDVGVKGKPKNKFKFQAQL